MTAQESTLYWITGSVSRRVEFFDWIYDTLEHKSDRRNFWGWCKKGVLREPVMVVPSSSSSSRRVACPYIIFFCEVGPIRKWTHSRVVLVVIDSLLAVNPLVNLCVCVCDSGAGGASTRHCGIHFLGQQVCDTFWRLTTKRLALEKQCKGNAGIQPQNPFKQARIV